MNTSSKRPRRERRSLLFLVCSTLLVLLAGMLTLLWQQQHSTRADDSNVVGAPTLPAATVDQIFTRIGSPMAGTGQVVEDAARNANIDDAFALAVWWAETNDGVAGVGLGDRNPGSVKGAGGYPVAYDGYTIYPSYADAIRDWFDVLRQRYVNRGLTSVYTICYPYVGTSGALNWANKVMGLMTRYRAEAPPTPTPLPPTPTPRDSIQESHATHLAQAQHAPVNRSATEPARAGTNTQPATHTVQAVQPLAGESLLIVLGLLLAVAVALWGVRLRRMLPVTAPEVVPLPITATLALEPVGQPPLYVNEFSPVIERGGVPLPAAFDAFSFEMIETAPVPATLSTASSFFSTSLSRAGKEARPRRVVLKREAEQTEQLASSYGELAQTGNRVPEPHTEALPPYRTGMSLPGRIREPVGVGRAGSLLQRYGDSQAKNRD